MGVMGFVIIQISSDIISNVMNYFRSSNKVNGRDMGIHYSTVDCIDAYIPQVKSSLFSYPLLACGVKHLGESKQLINWVDPHQGYDFYSLVKDVEEILAGNMNVDDSNDSSTNNDDGILENQF